MRRKAAALVPRRHVRRRFFHHRLPAPVPAPGPCHVSEADPRAVPDEPRLRRNLSADRRQRLVAAGGDDAIGFGEKRRFQRLGAALPFGDFQAGAQLVVRLVKGMGEQARHEGRAGGAFDKLRRARQQAQHHVRQHRGGNVSGRDVRQQGRAAGQGRPRFPAFRCSSGKKSSRRCGVPQFLPQQRLQIFRRQLFEKLVQSRRQHRARKSRSPAGPASSTAWRKGKSAASHSPPQPVQQADDARRSCALPDSARDCV